MEMVENRTNATIVRSTIDLAHNLGLKVVAEGVETPEVWALLQELNCDTIQGYLISKPLPTAAFEDWLAHFQHPNFRSYKTA